MISRFKKRTIFADFAGVSSEETVGMSNDTAGIREISDASLLCLRENVQAALDSDLDVC